MDNRCLVADPIRDSGVIEGTAVELLQKSAPCVRDDRRHPQAGVGSDSQLFELARGLALGPLSFSSERSVSGDLPLTRAAIETVRFDTVACLGQSLPASAPSTVLII